MLKPIALQQQRQNLQAVAVDVSPQVSEPTSNDKPSQHDDKLSFEPASNAQLWHDIPYTAPCEQGKHRFNSKPKLV
jgi:hypothetical protein